MTAIALPVATAAATPREPAYRVDIASDGAALRRLRPEWDALLTRSGLDHPFLGHAWIQTWWDCFGAGRALYTPVVHAAGSVVGIVPLMRSDLRLLGARLRCLGGLYNPHTPRFDFLVAPGNADSVYRSVWRHLCEHSAAWDVLQLPQLPPDSPALTTLAELARADGYAIGRWHGEQSPYLPLRGSWQQYLDGLSRNHWAKVRKGLNRLARRGAVHLEAVTSGEALAAALDDGVRIEAAAWKAQTGTAIRSAPDVERFYRAFATRAADLGALRLLFLTVAGVRIAFAYALSYGNKLYVLKAGYDPAYSYYSPYNLLCYLVFQDGFARGLDEYEFLGNNEPWKLDWTRHTRRHEWLYAFAPRWRPRLLHQAKFEWLPRLQRQRFYAPLRNLLLGRAPAR